MVFEPRLKAPSLDDPLYYSSQNIFTACGYGMENGNCTCYEHARYIEVCGTDSLCRGNAGGWIEEARKNGRIVSDVPVLGAIAVWKIPNTLNSGHVAGVEGIAGNADILTSNSAWQGTKFYLETFKASKKYCWKSKKTGKIYEFQGFIYPTINFTEKPKPLKATARLQFRQNPEKVASRIGTVSKGGIFLYDGNYKIVKGVKWMRGIYDSTLGWVSGLYVEEV